MDCPKCGDEVVASAKFCSTCGKDLSGVGHESGGVTGGAVADASGTAELPLASGAVAGAAAYVVNFVVVFALYLVESSGQPGSAVVDDHEYAGWMLYDAHNVAIETGGSSFNALESLYKGLANSPTASATVPKLAYYVLPVVVLGAAGWYVASRTGGYGDPTDGAKAGATVALGYAALGVLGALALFEVSVNGVSASPELGSTVLFFAAYAAVAGGVGGYFAAQ